jgi:hypothetical protein
MKRLLLALALSTVAALSARADELPKEYLGKWCENVNGQYYKADEPCDRSTITITRNELREIEGGCRFHSIRKLKADNPTVEIIARCAGEGSVGINKIRLTYAKGETLWIENKNLREIDNEEMARKRMERRRP